jgi:glycosyltransferase involved in cell wall biosynthesis
MKQPIVFCRSNPIAPDPRVEKETATLAEAGYQVSILGWDRSKILPPHEQEAGIHTYRLGIKADYGKGLANLPALLAWQWGLLSWLVGHRQDFEFIHACDFDTILPALCCKWVWNKKIVYDIFDFYADHLRSTPEMIKKIIRWLDIQAINRADAVILADEIRYQQIKPAHPRLSAVIYNSPPDLLSMLERAPTPIHHDGLRIAYVGLLQKERGLLEMLEVLARHPDWSLDLAGFGGDAQLISEKAAQLSNVRFHGRVPYIQGLQLSQQADVLFATYDPGIENHRYASPNKIFEAMMLAKPVIVARGTNMDRLVEKENCGKVIPYGVVSQLEEILTRLAAEPGLCSRLGKNGRKAYENTYRWELMQTRLLDLYQAVAST